MTLKYLETRFKSWITSLPKKYPKAVNVVAQRLTAKRSMIRNFATEYSDAPMISREGICAP